MWYIYTMEYNLAIKREQVIDIRYLDDSQNHYAE